MTMAGSRILVVDDEPSIRKLLRIGLAAHGYAVSEADSGRAGIASAALNPPDLLVLDLGLPDIDGRSVITELRGWTEMPIIVLSVRDREDDKIRSLDAGANDYVVKPFSVNELAARVRAALRHHGETGVPSLKLGAVEIDLANRRVTNNQVPVALTRKEFALLKVLARHPGRVVTQRQLLDEVWGPGHAADTHYLRIYIGYLRRKLGDDPAAPGLIVTEPGVGYRLRV